LARSWNTRGIGQLRALLSGRCLRGCVGRPHACVTLIHGLQSTVMALFRHNLISTQPGDRVQTMRSATTLHLCSFDVWKVGTTLRASDKNLSSTPCLQLSEKIIHVITTFALDNSCKRMYLGRIAYSAVAFVALTTAGHVRGCSINWKSPSRVGSTFRDWKCLWDPLDHGDRLCCALSLFGRCALGNARTRSLQWKESIMDVGNGIVGESTEIDGCRRTDLPRWTRPGVCGSLNRQTTIGGAA
jgi:hypothetical protein